MNANAFPESDMQLNMARNHIQLFSTVAGPEFMSIYERVRPQTMLSIERLYDMYLSCRYVEAAQVPGCILEVGVWKGGALGTALLSEPESTRPVIGFDTFEGHFMPEADEIDIRGHNMRERWIETTSTGETWAAADVDECYEFLASLTTWKQRISLVKGDAKVTVPDWSPQPIAILRIDCDWYAESKIALTELWPHVSIGGLLILDDYGHHEGQRRAVDEFFSDRPVKLTHVDYSCISILRTG